MRTALIVTAVGLVIASCGEPAGEVVGDGSYRALVPSSIQFAEVEADGIPGGFIPLREASVDTIEMIISGDDVTVLLDGREVISRRVEERLVVRDSEGSGPFKAEKEVLVLGEDPLVLAGLTIDRPVVWPGSFEGSPVVHSQVSKPRRTRPVGVVWSR